MHCAIQLRCARPRWTVLSPSTAPGYANSFALRCLAPTSAQLPGLTRMSSQEMEYLTTANSCTVPARCCLSAGGSPRMGYLQGPALTGVGSRRDFVAAGRRCDNAATEAFFLLCRRTSSTGSAWDTARPSRTYQGQGRKRSLGKLDPTGILQTGRRRSQGQVSLWFGGITANC